MPANPPARPCVEKTWRGTPCPAGSLKEPDPDGEFRCPQHTQDPEMRAKVQAGREAAWGYRQRKLSADADRPQFQSRDQIVSFMEQLAELVLKGAVDPKLSSEARGCASVAMTAHELTALEKLNALEARILGRHPRSA